MTDRQFVALPHRHVISISGDDTIEFLQGLITNDIDLVADDHAIYSALLTPQGKLLHDFFVLTLDNKIYLDCETARYQDLITRLTRYRLRANVDIRDTEDEFIVYALFGKDLFEAKNRSAFSFACY